MTDKKKYNNTLLTCICAAVIAVITYFVFSPSLNDGFTNWDDDSYVTTNPLVINNSAPLVKIFDTPVSSNYNPLTVLSLALNYQASKLEPYGYHLENIILHELNTMLVFLFIFLLTRRNLLIAAIVSLFFGIHPMHVESVSWISERKDVLYVFFFMVGLITYLRYSNTKKTGWYIFTFLLFILSCLSKGMAVVFPVILLLIDYLRGVAWSRKLLIEKIPFFILSILFGIITVKAQQTTQTFLATPNFTVFQRILFASYGAIFYIVKLFVPYKLSAFYGYPITNSSGSVPLVFYLAPFVLLTLSAILVYFFKKKEKEIVFGLLFYFVSVVLVLQFVSIGYAITADRYSYLSYIGLLFVAAYLINKAWQGKGRVFTLLKYPLMIVVIMGAVVFCFQTYARTQVWKDSETLWTNTIDTYPDAFLPYNNRGLYYLRTGENDLALADFNKAIELDPFSANAYNDRAILYLNTGKIDPAIDDYTKAIYYEPSAAACYLNRGLCYETAKQYEKAISDFTRGIQLNPKNADLYYNMRGICNSNLQNYTLAIADFTKALQIDTSVTGYWLNRSIAETKAGQDENAKADALRAQQLQPHP